MTMRKQEYNQNLSSEYLGFFVLKNLFLKSKLYYDSRNIEILFTTRKSKNGIGFKIFIFFIFK